MALTALREALRLSLRGSQVYLFTDARAKDYHLLAAVLAFVQLKESQVVFFLTGDCGDPTQPGLVAFQQIAAASSGHVFRLRETDVKEVANFVKASMQPDKVSLVSVDARSQDIHLLEMNIDSTVRELMVSISGERPQLVLINPQGRSLAAGADMDVALDVANALAVVVRAPAAGRWQMRVSSADGRHTVRATGVSEAGFRHGFSRQPVEGMRHTQRTPLSGSPAYVLVNGSSSSIVLRELHLVSVSGGQLAKLVLNPVSRRATLYNASTSFVPPDDFFFLKVVGTDKAGYPVNRLTPTALRAEPPDIPEVVTRQRLLVATGANATLRCSIRSLLPAVAQWQRDGSPLAGPQRLRSLSGTAVFFVASKTGLPTSYIRPIIGFGLRLTPKRARRLPSHRRSVHGGDDGPKITVREGAVVTVAKGSSRTLACFASGTPKPQVRWSKDGSEVTKGLQPDGSLLIDDVAEADAGDYTCDATSTAGSDSYTVRVHVQLPPQILASASQDVYQVVENAAFSLDCRSLGSPAPKLEWYKDGRLVDAAVGHLGITFSAQQDDLRVAAAKLIHDGVYKCVASNAAGSTERRFRVIVLLPPQIQGPPREVVRVVEGQEVTLSCRAEGTPAPSATFLRDGVSWPSDERGDGYRELYFATAMAERDAGVYVCRATNEAGSAQKLFELVVLVPPAIEDHETLGVVRVRVGSKAVLRCAATGVPSPEVSWLLGASRISGADGRLRPGASELVIETARQEDAGRYRCSAVNEVGTASREFLVDVLVPPGFKSGGRVSWELLEGEPVTFDCTATGNPAPDVVWFKGSSEIIPGAAWLLQGGTDVIRGGHALSMFHVVREHAGPYSCAAINELGRATRNFSLSVLVRPTMEAGPSQRHQLQVAKGNSVALFCNVTGLPSPVVRWLRDDQPVQFRAGVSLFQSGRGLNISSIEVGSPDGTEIFEESFTTRLN
ncbi:hypothetical protein V5799_032726 [Amblyomma americanum]|uniref:Ig-like domain-containing protein n=1 Tax=Amblyomma americanum TaxID=6943 RepID=A0AAQ4DQC4_AMBAM